MNYYEILEVSPKASQGVLKAAYKSLMQRYHPDRNPGNAQAAEHSVLVTRAYEVLSDSSKRSVYDNELKVKLVNSINIQERVRNTLATASLDESGSGTHWLWWLLIAVVVIFIWFLWSPLGKQQSAGSETKVAGSLFESYQPGTRQNNPSEYSATVTARTIPEIFKDINVDLAGSAESADVKSAAAKSVLSIQTIGVVVGTFDPDKFISFMENNKEFISRKLSEKLVNAKYEMLIKHNGDQYLKQYILHALGEITDTNRLDEYPSTGTHPPSHYGVVDIVLPDSYTVNAKQPDQPSTP